MKNSTETINNYRPGRGETYEKTADNIYCKRKDFMLKRGFSE